MLGSDRQSELDVFGVFGTDVEVCSVQGAPIPMVATKNTILLDFQVAKLAVGLGHQVESCQPIGPFGSSRVVVMLLCSSCRSNQTAGAATKLPGRRLNLSILMAVVCPTESVLFDLPQLGFDL